MPSIPENSNGTEVEPLIFDSGVESASQEAPPDYDLACSAWSLAQLDDDVLDSRSSRNDLSILGITIPSLENRDDVCLLDRAATTPTVFRNRLPSVEIYPTEKPPPFCREPLNYDFFTHCKVCLEVFKVTGKLNQSVVKCPHCNEATPIRDPPVGKKFVRCPCNCLLVAKQTAMRIACPRPDCKKIINLHSNRMQPGRETASTGHRVICGHCAETFVVDILRDSGYARCPRCDNNSSIGSNYKHSKIIIYSVVTGVFIIVTIILFVGFWELAKTHQFLFVLWSFLVVCLLFCVYKLYSFCKWRVSEIVESDIPENVEPPPETENQYTFSNNLLRFSSFRRSFSSAANSASRSRSRSRSNTNPSVTIPLANNTVDV